MIAQNRNAVQSFYRLDYSQAGDLPSAGGTRAFIQFWFRGFSGMFGLGSVISRKAQTIFFSYSRCFCLHRCWRLVRIGTDSRVFDKVRCGF